jgi:asparagine synthase (glutamine-hydrolysing)
MCGIWGFVGQPLDPAVSTRIGESLAHRGPDDAGVWSDPSAGVTLGHRRLAIVDLSAAGHQPMTSACGRFVVVFNGEIYNHLDLRSELERIGAAPAWRGHSDTETMLAAFVQWGITAAVQRMTGMFAFALWDRERRELTLARDRLGEKPLYFGRLGKAFVFASELKALRAHPAFDCEIDRDALTLLLRHNYIPAPHTIYRGIRKLEPSTLLTLAEGGRETRSVYWSARDAALHGIAEPYGGGDSDAVDALERMLKEAIGRQMVADVPLGAFLSGGVDSSTVVALMQAQSSRPVKTFTIGFHEQGYDEAEHAHAVAAHLGCEHTELYVSPQQALDVIPRLPALYDEPFADSSQIPTFLVAQLARQHVTVSLSGDGGDELFGGYNRYLWAARIWRRLGNVPAALRGSLAGLLTGPSPATWNRLFDVVRFALPNHLRYGNPGDKLHKLADMLGARSADEVYLFLVSLWRRPADIVVGGREPATVLTEPEHRLAASSFESRMMYLDQVSYLPDDILAKVDRAAMGVSLETRVPMLDHKLIEFAWQLPLDMKIRNGSGKWLLRQVLYRHVPQQLIDRPKMGFGVPIDIWLRGPLRDWAESLLAEDRLRREAYFDPLPVRAKWQEHLSGRRNWQYHLWSLLMFQSWLETTHGR